MKYKKGELTCYTNFSSKSARHHPFQTNDHLMNSNSNGELNSIALSHNQLRLVDDNHRRYRTAFTREQLQLLEKEFSKENYVTRPKRCDLASRLKLPESTIKIWYQNRRMNKRQKMVLPWTYPADPHLAAYMFAYLSQMQQPDFWQQAKTNLVNNSLMPQLNISQQARQTPNSSAMSALLPAPIPPLFVAPPLISNPLINASPPVSLPSLSDNSSQQTQSSTPTPSAPQLNSIPPYLSSELSYNLMLRNLGFNASVALQQQTSTNNLNNGFLNHLRELSDAQSNKSNESNNCKLTTEHSEHTAIKPSLDFRSSSSASNSSDCSSIQSPTTPVPSQLTNNNYLTNSPSSSSLSGHNICKPSNQSLKNLNQINTEQRYSPDNSPAHSPNQLFQSNGNSTFINSSSILNNKHKSIKIESPSTKNDLKVNDLSTIENLGTTLGNQTMDLIGSNCLSKPLFQPYLSKH